MGSRFAVVIGFVGIAYGGLLYHLYGLQIVHGAYYVAKAESVEALSGTLLPQRGSLFFTDKTGEKVPVALQKDFPEIFADPSKIEDPEAAAALIGPIIHEDPDALVSQLAQQDHKYKLLSDAPSEAMISAIEAEKVKGVQVALHAHRFYPLGTFAAQVLGFVGPDAQSDTQKGRYGVEEFYDTTLAGTPGTATNGKHIPPVDGKDVVLTLDPNIQSE